jgi:hypothetical protein
MKSARGDLRVSLLVGVLMIAGCSGIGPPTVARDRFDYNGEVARSWKEQTLLNIVKGRPERPTDALVAIALRGGWFWIDDRDVASKSTFGLVMLLSTLAETGPRETPPLLTIPAG